MLNSELSIFLCFSDYWLSQTRICGRAVVLVSYPSRSPIIFLVCSCSFFSFLLLLLLFPLLSDYNMLTFASFNRGQPPARHTKVVDDNLRPLKSGSTCLCVPVCAHDVVSSKPTSVGRDTADVHTQTICGCVVSDCCSVRCKTCHYISQCSTFVSNVTKKSYNVVSPNLSMDCTSDNVVYLITCKKCGIQYVGETSQKLRSRFSNHWNRLKKLTNLYLYHHFSSDGHSVDDMSIMPIEELTSSDRVSATSQRLEREDYWCRELCTYYPYGLNDNVRGVGNISKQHGLVVYTLFNRRQRKFRKRNKRRRKIDYDDLTSRLEDCVRDYKSHVFMFNIRSLILSLPKKCKVAIWTFFEACFSEHEVPARVVVLIKDMIAFKKGALPIETNDVDKLSKKASGFLNICYHNKGIEMINVPRILNSRYVRDAVPQFINNRVPPTISYKYTKAIGGRIFNQKKVVKELDIDKGAGNMCCDCSGSKYCYEPAGHVITGDLKIVKDAELRGLIEKGPSYREQNYINWNVNKNLWKEAVAKYKLKWSQKERVDIRALNEWECKVNECIERRIRSLKSKHINRRKKHILKSEKHLKSLQELHSKYVLVPADKASGNVIVVCKKHYLEVVLEEVNATTTYEHFAENYSKLVNEHLKFMTASPIVQPDCRCLPQFYWLPKIHKKPYGARFIAASKTCTTKP